MRRFRASLQRPEPTFSPARLMRASAPRTASFTASHPTPRPSRTREGSRESTATSSPRASSARTSGLPMKPLPPATTMFMRAS